MWTPPLHFWSVLLVVVVCVCDSQAAIMKREVASSNATSKYVPVAPEILAALQAFRKNVTLNPKATLKDNNATIVLLEDPSLTYGQIAYILNFLGLGNRVIISDLPSNLLIALPSSFILEITDGKANSTLLLNLAKRVGGMAPSQSLALFLQKLIVRDGKTNVTASLNDSKVADLFTDYANSSKGVAMLLQYISPKEFKANLKNFETFMSGQQDVDTKFEIISYLPKSLRRAWFEEKKPKVSGNDEPSLSTLTCLDLTNYTSFSEVKKVLGIYNSLRMRLPTAPFSSLLLGCFRQRIQTFLEEIRNKSQSPADQKPLFDYLTRDDIRSIGGNVLGSFDMKYLTEMRNNTVASAVFRAIGAVPLTDIISSIPRDKAENITKLAVKSLDKEGGYTADDLVRLGSLVYLSGEVASKAEPGALMEYVQNYTYAMQFACLTNAAMMDWNVALGKAYGNTSAWSSMNVSRIVDLLITLDDSQLTAIRLETLFYAFPILVDNSRFAQTYLVSPDSTNETKIVSVCRSWLQEEGDHFNDAYERLMKFYLRAAQLTADGKNQVGGGGSRKKRDVDLDFSTVEGSRFKRQVAEADPVDMVYKKKIQTLLPLRGMSMTKTIELELAMSNLRSRTRAEAARMLGLDSPPSKDQTLQNLINDKVNSGDISAATADSVSNLMNAAQRMANEEVVRIVGLTYLDLNVERREFCDYFSSMCAMPYFEYLVLKFNSSAANGTKDNAKPAPFPLKELPSSVNCTGLKQASFAADVLSVQDLQNWTKSDLENCLEVLGLIKWPLDKKMAVWKLLKEKKVKQVQASKLDLGYMLALNHLLEAVVYDNMTRLDLDAGKGRESLSVLGDMTFPRQTLANLTAQLMVDTKAKIPTRFVPIDVVMFGSMKHLLCGFDNETLWSLMNSSQTAQFLLPILGSMRDCPNPEALQIFAQAAKAAYGDTAKWNASTILGLGVIVAGLSPDDFASLRNCCIAAISGETGAHLTPDQINALSVEKSGHLAPEVQQQLRRNGIQLSKEKRQAMEASANATSATPNLAQVRSNGSSKLESVSYFTLIALMFLRHAFSS